MFRMTSLTLNERIQIVINTTKMKKVPLERNGDLDEFIVPETLRVHSQSEDS